jgi:hypothetical protein
MKRFFTNFAVMALFALVIPTLVKAQGTDGLGLVLKVTIDGVSFNVNQGACGYETADWGGTITEELCSPAAWAKDSNGNDSLACDPVPAGQLTGKIALIRRGACEFGLKALNAQLGGALAAIVCNNVSATAGDDCNAIPMGAGANGAQVTIPTIFLCRQVTNVIDAALNAGKVVEICFQLPNVSAPYVSAAYATPKSQVDSIDLMSFVFYNRGLDTINGVTIKADITGPNGYSNSISTTWDGIPPGYDGLLFFDTYLPPAVVGKYDVVMSNSLYTESRDTLRRSFEITENTFAVDNFGVNQAPFNNTSFVAGGFVYQTGALYFSGPNGGNATCSTFGIGNIDSLFTGDPFADEIAVLLYDGDSDEDGVINFQSGGFDDLAADVIGSGSYILTGTETLTGLVTTALSDFVFGGPVALKPSHPYYISLLYDGTTNGSGRCPGFSASSGEDYLVYDGNALTTPLRMDNTYSGWGGATLVNRMQMNVDCTISTKDPQKLDASKFAISPNPGSEYVNLNLDLNQVNSKVIVRLLNAAGQLYATETLTNFQSGQVRFDVNKMPSGHYLMWISTEEGNTIQKVAVCH